MNTDIMPPAPAPAEVKQPPAELPQPAPDTPAPQAPQNKKPEAPAAPKTGSGVGSAIAATVIIVLGLAALATYAYLQTR